MAISQYWVGQIPSRPLAIDVRDSAGNRINLAGYTIFNIVLVGSDNEIIDHTGSTLNTAGAAEGRFVFRFPTDRSLFTKQGEYLLQLEIGNDTGVRDYTTTHTIKVKRLGGRN